MRTILCKLVMIIGMLMTLQLTVSRPEGVIMKCHKIKCVIKMPRNKELVVQCLRCMKRNVQDICT